MSDAELNILDKVFAYIKSCGENIDKSVRKGSVVILWQSLPAVITRYAMHTALTWKSEKLHGSICFVKL